MKSPNLSINLDITRFEAEKVVEAVKNKKRLVPKSVLLKVYLLITKSYLDRYHRKLTEEEHQWISQCIAEATEDIEEQKDYWKTKDGKVMLISEMTDSHLLNAIRALKKGAVKAIILKGEETTVKKRLSFTSYDNLVKEAKKRGLIKNESD